METCLQAQKNLEVSFQKLRILKMSMENRLEEFPQFAKTGQTDEQGEDQAPPILPRPAQLTGTFYLKLLGVEGLLDLYTLRQMTSDLESNSPPRTWSFGQVRSTSRFMTLPNPNREKRGGGGEEKERAVTAEDDLVSSTGANSLKKRRDSKHGRSNKNTSLSKQYSLDHIDQAASESVASRLFTCPVYFYIFVCENILWLCLAYKTESE